jgi:tyrosinase
MTKSERVSYTAAVKCLYNSPSKSDPQDVPGARNRLDDVVATHLNQVHQRIG